MNTPRRPGPPSNAPYPSFEERAYGNHSADFDRTLRAPARHAPPNSRPPRQRRKRGFGLGSLFLLVVFAVIAIGSAGTIFLVMNPPTELIRTQMIEQIRQRTGRTLTIAGPTNFTIFPSLGLSMKDVTLSPPPGMTGPDFAKMAGLDVSVRLLPLLKRQVSVDQLVLQQPVINLLVDKTGRKNWDFASSHATAPPIRIAQAAGNRASDAPGGIPADAQEFLKHANRSAQSSSSGQAELAMLSQLQLADVRIVNGTLNYVNTPDNSRHLVDAVNVQLQLDDIYEPLRAKGDARWRQVPVTFDSTITSMANILSERPAKVVMKLDSTHLNARYDGTVHVQQSVAASGAVALKSTSLRNLAAWTGTTLPPARGFGAMTLTGLLNTDGATHKLTSTKLDLDDQLAQGTIIVRTGAKRPHVTADLTISQLDLNNYLSDGTIAATPAATTPKPKTKTTPKAKPKSIEDLLNTTGTRVQGYVQRTGWSKEVIDASALSSADVDAKLLIGRLLVKRLKIGQSDLNVSLKNNILQTKINDIALYDGRGSGVISIKNNGAKGASIASDVKLAGVQALGLLQDAVDQDWLEGKGTINLALAGSGRSQNDIMNTLAGTGKIALADGALVGFNIAQIIRGVSQGDFSVLTKREPSQSQKTDFSSLDANWIIKDGIATNQDLALISPLLRVGGQGAVMLGSQAIDYTIRPKLVASLEGQGRQQANSGLEIPVRINGPWTKPKIEPQLGDILSNPNQAIDAVKKLGEQFKGKNTNEILDGLLGKGNASSSGGSSGDTKATPAQDLLDRFLR